jgi:hypothetical protein
MPVQPLPLLEEPFELSKAAKAIQKKCNIWIAEFNQKLRTFDEAVRAATESDPDAVGSLADMADNLEREKMDLLVEERKLRVLMQSYFKERNEAHGKATDALRIAWEATKEKLHQDLLSIGYVDGRIPGGTQQCLIPLFYMHHPAHFLAQQQYQACQSACGSDSERTNRERIEFIDEEIRAVRDRLLRSVRR